MLKIRLFAVVIFCALAVLFRWSMSIAADKNDYYPITPGSEWIMNMTTLVDNSVSEQRTTIEKNPEVFEGVTYSVIKQIDPRTKMTFLILKNDKGVYWRKVSVKVGFMPEISSSTSPQAAPILQFPLTKGSKGEWNGKYSLPWSEDKYIIKHEVQDDAEEVSVPAGKFKCLKVRYIRTIGKETEEETCWYSKGVGLVKYQSKKIIKELKSFNVK